MLKQTSSMLLLQWILIILPIFTMAQAESSNTQIELNKRANSTADSKTPVAGFYFMITPAAAGVVLYAQTAVLEWIHYFRIGQKYMLTLTIGMTCMMVGMILRIIVIHFPYSVAIYAIMDLFILLSPCAFLATDYILLSRLANSLGRTVADNCLLLPSTRITKIFVWSDVITFLIQAVGGALSTSGKSSSVKVGEKVALVGLSLQLVSFVGFTLILIVFGLKVHSKYPQIWAVNSRGQTLLSVAGPFKTTPAYNWKVLYYTMCLTCVGILIRSAFRIVEFSGGYFGYVAEHEWFFYFLDALPLWMAMSLYCLIWPVRFFNRENTPLDYPEAHEMPVSHTSRSKSSVQQVEGL
ncbi:RTA1-domain-containing protein [Gymnopus androsaceus JB14]|uniref:RTA1-domain-containing protein n=1 Tax=Gymnopus androsaceus JB14 TaxID=1447944 RepID=A0A6A4HE80_9AGAR|nr:RTA1-domain-containing protein [Gymnopus androsaceus JB14]